QGALFRGRVDRGVIRTGGQWAGIAVPAIAVPRIAIPAIAVPRVAVPAIAVPGVAVPAIAVPAGAPSTWQRSRQLTHVERWVGQLRQQAVGLLADIPEQLDAGLRATARERDEDGRARVDGQLGPERLARLAY